MAGQSTVLAVGGVTVPASGFFSQQAIAAIQKLIENDQAIVTTYSGDQASLLPPITPPGPGGAVLVVSEGSAVNANLPLEYGTVMTAVGSDVTLVGGSSDTTLVAAGSLNFSGDAGEVLLNGPTALVSDSADGADIELAGGLYTVRALGIGQDVSLFEGAATIAARGNGSTINLGSGEPSESPANDVPLGPKAAVWLGGSGSTINLAGAMATITDVGGGATINGGAGAATIFAGSGDVYRGSGAAVTFIGGGDAQTVFGGLGRDVVYGEAGDLVFNEGSGSNHAFVGGSGSATVAGDGAGLIWGGNGKILDQAGGGSDEFVAGGTSGAATIQGGSKFATVFAAGSGNSVSLTGHSGGVLVVIGRDDELDASASNGNDDFYVPGLAGNSTLVGSAHAGDSFIIANSGATASHTITVEDYRPGDAFYLSGYDDADARTATAAVQGHAGSFTLSDGTTVTFVGLHPTVAAGSVFF